MYEKHKKTLILGIILTVICTVLISCLVNYVRWYVVVSMFLIEALVVAAFLIGLKTNREWLYKFSLSSFYIGIFVLIVFGAIMWSGLYQQFYDENGKLDNDAVTAAIASKGSASAFFFIALSFLQVTFIPIPSTVTALIGIALFGNAKGFLYSLIGQVAGMFFAYVLGKKFGAKLIIWIVGEDAFFKYHKIIKGRDKIVLFFMFLFPFFPDDILCMFAGLTTYTPIMFLLVLIITRCTTLGYTVGGMELIQQIKGLGFWTYVIYAAVGIVVFGTLILVWKKGDILEEKMLKFIEKIIPKKYRRIFVSDIDAQNIEKRTSKEELPFGETVAPTVCEPPVDNTENDAATNLSSDNGNDKNGDNNKEKTK